MNKISNGKLLNGSSMPKMPSKREVEAMVKKRKEDEQELVSKMNILPRDEEKYPMPDEKDVKNAGALLYTLGVLSESYDGNLKALLWDYYVEFMKCLRSNSTQEDLFAMIGSVTNLKKYLAKSGNPLFTENVPQETPKQ